MTQNIIQTSNAPRAIGPYSQAVRAGDLIFVSGQIPIDPQSGELERGKFREQAYRVLANLEAICVAAGGSLNNVVKLTVYFTDLADFSAFNEVMAEVFAEPYPARAAVQVGKLPKGVPLEVEAVVHMV